MAGPRRQLPEIHGPEFTAHRLLGDHDAELLPNPLTQIDEPPPNDLIDGRDRTTLNDRHKRRALRIVQSRWLARGLTVDEPVWTSCIEPQ